MAKARYKRAVKKAVRKAQKWVNKANAASKKAAAAATEAVKKAMPKRTQRTLFNPWAFSRRGWVAGTPIPRLGKADAFSKGYTRTKGLYAGVTVRKPTKAQMMPVASPGKRTIPDVPVIDQGIPVTAITQAAFDEGARRYAENWKKLAKANPNAPISAFFSPQELMDTN